MKTTEFDKNDFVNQSNTYFKPIVENAEGRIGLYPAYKTRAEALSFLNQRSKKLKRPDKKMFIKKVHTEITFEQIK